MANLSKSGPTPTGVHLVGSVPMDDSQAVFALCCEHVGPHLQRLPDGETGKRSNWIAWQQAVFAATPQLEPVSTDPGAPFQIKTGMNAADISFPSLGYAQAALDSYAQFGAMKQQGAIPQQVRFQVSLPTPLAPVQFYITEDDRAAVEPIYELSLLNELQKILDKIPASELAVQWDTAVEFGVLEGVFPSFFTDPLASITQRLVRLGDLIPADVELGYHLCYGDAFHKHFVEPKDTQWLTDVANGVLRGTHRLIQWIHLPVPKDRSDDAYFAPLKNLNLTENTELYLGLIHTSDGLAGAQQRIEAAQRVCKEFGVATECGFGRRPQATLHELLKLHAATSKPRH